MTFAPLVKSAWQLAPQSMPAGLLVTLPLPVPAFATVRSWSGRVNVAVDRLRGVIETVQVAEAPVHAPFQPVNVEPAPGRPSA